MQSREELVALGKRLADPAKGMLVAMGTAMGNGLVQIVLALFVAFFFYRDGDLVKTLLAESASRLAGAERAPLLVATAQSAVKGVVYGLIGTAFAQALVALVGFLIAGVPGAMVLAALTFVLSLVPMGPVLVWGGAAADPIGMVDDRAAAGPRTDAPVASQRRAVDRARSAGGDRGSLVRSRPEVSRSPKMELCSNLS